jgi:sialate O-acetylesterase
MEFALRGAANAKAEIAAANYPQIRLYTVKRRVSEYPLEDTPALTWTAVTPGSVAEFSAVAYFFGRDLYDRNHVPIGLVESSWGGTPAEAWTSMTSLTRDASLMPVFADWGKMMRDQVTTLRERARENSEFEAAVAKAKAEGKPEPWKPWHQNEDNCWMPSGLFNAMIAPLTRFPIRGAIWYQGESNADQERAPLYARLFGTMIQDWRETWGQGDFPFLFVQIANFKTNSDAGWPEVRDAQRRTLSLVNTGMAVTIDIGEVLNIHPLNKQDVGARLALAARAIADGERTEYSGPMFRAAVRDGSAMRIYFDHAQGLKAKGSSLTGFEVAGADGKFFEAVAQIDGTTVVVSNSSIAEPVRVRYAWKDAPEASLFNAAGLPASPFQSGQ